MAAEDRRRRVDLPPTLAAKVKELAGALDVGEGQALARAIDKAQPKDLTEEAPTPAEMVDGAPRTKLWARLASPFGWFVVGILAFSFVAPFFLISGLAGLDPATRVDKLLTWATHVLAPIVGLASAVITYFFGRGAAGDERNG
jgi:hypothetical protein